MDTVLNYPEEYKTLRVEEYKALRDEMTMCQHEMHRTWLWGSVAAAGVYTFLYLHWKEINREFPADTHSEWVLVIPPILLCFCLIRYFVFWKRVRRQAKYIKKLEEKAFPVEPSGAAHWNDGSWWGKMVAVAVASAFWAMLIGSSSYVSWTLWQMRPPPGPPASATSPPAVSAQPTHTP
jgi:hypothetical protein